MVYNTEPRKINLNENPGNKGKEVILKGSLTTYFGVAAMKETSDYVLEGGSTTPEEGVGTGTKEDPYDIKNAIAKQGETGKWIKAYIVGAVPGAKLEEAQFTAPFTSYSNILVAASTSETDPSKCFPIQLVTKTEPRINLNLGDHPEMLGKEVKLLGDLTTYFNVAAMKSTSDYEIVGGSVTPGDNDGTKEKPFNISEFAAKNGTTGIWVEAYIVGDVPSAKLEEAEFAAPFTSETNILIAASPTEKDVTKCVPVQLPKALRPDLGLKNKADILGKKIKINGDAATYFNVTGMKNTSEFEFEN